MSSFGGDQLLNADASVVTAYFLAFYFSINMGSFVTYIVSPLARSHISYSAGACDKPQRSRCVSWWQWSSAQACCCSWEFTARPCAVQFARSHCRLTVPVPGAGFGLQTVVLTVALATFMIAKRRYTIIPPTGSILGTTARYESPAQ